MYEARKFDSIKELKGVSEKTMTEHYKLYEGYVKKYNEIMDKLATVDLESANQTFSDIRSLKVDLTFAIGGIKNHELYFSYLGGDSQEPTGKLLERINKDFGSFEAWQKDMKATALAARGWAWLAYDWKFDRLFNFIGDAQNSFPVWNATPLLALDVYEHAYFLDYATKRSDYIDAFFSNLSWNDVSEFYDKLEV